MATTESFRTIARFARALLKSDNTIHSLNRAARSILSSNTKLEKLPSGVSAINSGVAMAPARRSGVVNVCPHATAACIAACVLWFAGRTVSTVVRKAAIARTKLWRSAPSVFYSRLRRSLANQARRAAKIGARSFCRLNIASDIDHLSAEYVDVGGGPVIAEERPETDFYGYTKDVARMVRYLNGEYPANYHESLSIHEHSSAADVIPILARGGNVVVVVDSYYWGPTKRYGTLPEFVTFTGPGGQTITVPAVDGDVSDVRTPEFDGRGVAVCLRLKGSNRAKDRARSARFARPFQFGGKGFSVRFGMPRARGILVVDLIA